MMEKVILIRYSEMHLKGQNKRITDPTQKLGMMITNDIALFIKEA